MRVAWHIGAAAGQAVVAAAAGQCNWAPGEGIPGVSSTVRAATTWDPDGPGPLVPRLVVGGGFTLAGTQATRGVAAWDGVDWHAMPMPVGAFVQAMAVLNGELIAGSSSTAPGVSRWDGSGWQLLGPAMGGTRALAVWNGELYAGGLLTGLSDSHTLVRWDGGTWQPVAGEPAAEVMSLLPDGQALYAGGQFQSVGAGTTAWAVAKLENGAWSALGPPTALSGWAAGLAKFGGELYATGNFAVNAGSTRNLARFDGAAWSPVGGGLGAFPGYALMVSGGRLVVGGEFTAAGGAPSTGGLAVWDGAQWVSIGGARNTYALTEYNGGIAAGGSILGVGITPVGSLGVKNIAWHDGVQWRELGSGFNNEVLAMAELNGDLIVSGAFRHAGSVATGSVARLGPSGWEPMGPFFNSDPIALTMHQGELYAGGNFSLIGTSAISRLAKWNGTQWVAVSPATFNGPVQSLGTYQNQLVVGGVFSQIGSTVALRIARFDGSAWSGFGSGIGTAPVTGDTGVKAMLESGGQLIVGGRFGYTSTNWPNIARWNGSAWENMGALGTSENYSVRSLAVHGGQIYAAGLLSVGPGPLFSSVARWDGTTWQPVPGTAGPVVNAIASHGGSLYAGGSFAAIGGIAAANIARWDGQAWTGLGTGVDSMANAVWPRGDEVVVGGRFLLADGAPSSYLSRWRCGPCAANCDGSTILPVLNVNDFVCFLNRFSSGDPQANCDGSTTPPVLNVNDFICFQTTFAQGCG